MAGNVTFHWPSAAARAEERLGCCRRRQQQRHNQCREFHANPFLQTFAPE
jgi:hypothetical protein